MKIKNVILFTAAIFLATACTSENNAQSKNGGPAPQDEAQAPKGNENTGYKIGDVATDFKLLNVDGEIVSLENYEEAKGFIVVFTCNHCPFSIANEDRLIMIDKKFKQLGYPVVAINPNDPEVNEDDSYEKMVERAEEKGFTFPYLFDEGQKIYPQYGATKTPHVYVLQKTDDGMIVKYIGAIDNSARDEEKATEHYLVNALNDLIAGRDPKVATTKAIGCSIKAKKK